MKMSPVVHFEMPYKNPKRISKFYKTVFGWGMQYLPKMGKYILATTTTLDKKTQRPKDPGAINGGFYPVTKTSESTHFVIAVENLEEYMKMVEEAGGKVLGKPMDIPGIGMFVMMLDPEGNRIGMLQPMGM